MWCEIECGVKYNMDVKYNFCILFTIKKLKGGNKCLQNISKKIAKLLIVLLVLFLID